MLPSEAKDRKEYPIGTGVLDYFPDAIAEVAHVSYVGNQQHNPGEPLHWARDKSTDEADALQRHFVQRGKFDSDGLRHSAKMAWRALALLQKELEEVSLVPIMASGAENKINPAPMAERVNWGFTTSDRVVCDFDASSKIKIHYCTPEGKYACVNPRRVDPTWSSRKGESSPSGY